MKKVIIIFSLIIAVVAVGAFIYSRNNGGDGIIRVSGTIEATDAEIGFRIPGLLAKRLVDEGETIEKGQEIALLESSEQEIAVKQAKAQLQQAQAKLVELENGARPEELDAAEAELEAARAALEKTESTLEGAELDFKRAEELYANKNISVSEYDQYRIRLKTARGARAQAAAQVKSAEENLKLLRKGPRKEKIDQARAQVEGAHAKLEQAELNLEYTTLSAPFSGVVLSKSAEPGEYMNPGTPVLTVGDLDNVWLRAYVSETDLGRIRLGQSAAVSTDSYSGKTYKGRLSFISGRAEFTPKPVQTFKERVKLMYRIKIDLNNPEHELKPGMPADAVIHLEE
ncbi:MAG: efflux RND transporter periplasmic adaptor subunit [Verrucomicrobia bacterium]|nr:efflux RND transporter periplasmic adaptor subunit [Verrucomicrobiota bacterium]MCF7709065.1 efflux RND transporter periplasmic adaptor subunit [Verrucomicrobiota bacterium]